MTDQHRPKRSKGRQWLALKKEVLRRYGDNCHLCGHGGANSADHLEPVTEAPERELDLSNLRPAHGYPKGCPVCSQAAGKPIYCNERRGAYSVERFRRRLQEDTGLSFTDPDEYDDW